MTTKIDLRTWIDQAVHALENSETPNLEVQVIAAFALGKSREWVIGHSEEILQGDQIEKMNGYLARLQEGEPLAYITGKQAFYGLDFNVSPAVLIPRPETELLVEEAIQWLASKPNRKKVLDMCTGSGIIAITLVDSLPAIKMTAVDVSAEALAVAKKNAQDHTVEERICWEQSDLFARVEGNFDLILSNPPYIPSGKLKDLSVSKYEPRLALDGGMDGMSSIRTLFQQAAPCLLPGGALMCEIESTLGEPILSLARTVFPDAEIDLLLDYADLPRLVRIQK